MAVLYKLKKYKNKSSDFNGYVYARVATIGEMNLSDIASMIERNCSLKKSDVKACLTELIEVMADALQDSKKVKLDGLGTFYPNIKGSLAKDPDTFDSGTNIKSIGVNFLPAFTVDQSNNRIQALTSGARVQAYDQYVAGSNDTYTDTASDSVKETTYTATEGTGE